MTSKSNKGVKLSLSEFMGAGGGNNAIASLPKGPAERAPDDDGAFKRPVRRNDNYNDQPPSRSEGDGNWRRGGGGGGGGNDNSSSGASNNRTGGGFENSRNSAAGNSRGGFSRDSGNDFRSGSSTTNSNDNWRSGNSSRESITSGPAPAVGERPRLQLKSRTIPSPTAPSVDKSITNNDTQPTAPVESSIPTVTPEASLGKVEAVNNETEQTNATNESQSVVDEVKDGNIASTETPSSRSPVKHERKEKVKREPEVINSRAAAFGAGSSASNGNKNETSSDRNRHQGPPPILNTRFEKLLVEEERERKTEQDNNRRPGTNSRFSTQDEADRSNSRTDDRGPPPVVNSRFAAAAAADTDYVNRDIREQHTGNRYAEPVINSRFAAAAEADRSHKRPDDRGPPPVANSRFAAAAAADTDYMNREHREQQAGGRFNDQPATSRFPSSGEADLPVNSRFAAAAAADSDYVNRENRDQSGGRFAEPVVNSRFAAAAEADRSYKRSDDRGPPLAVNSRFAAAAAADTDYVNRESREQSGGRFGDRGDRRSGPSEGGRGGRMHVASDHYEEPPPPQQSSRVDELLKPKKQDDAPVVPLTKQHEDNMLKIPDKAFKKEEDTFLITVPKKAEQSAAKAEEKLVPVPVVSGESVDSLLAEFASGEKLGEELKEWCVAKQPLPPVEKLLFNMLKEKEKLNPDPNCSWAEPSQYGAALLFLITENLHNQLQILWAIQMYCETLGFPKVDGESVVQSMFRAMYKYDLAEADAFIEWKEDESDEHEKGKMTTIVQTMDWFNWLEADDDEEEGEDEEEDME